VTPKKKSFIGNGSNTRIEFFFWQDEKLYRQKLFFARFFEKTTGPESLSGPLKQKTTRSVLRVLGTESSQLVVEKLISSDNQNGAGSWTRAHLGIVGQTVKLSAGE